uniref:septation protein SepH n=1 Tax=Actinomadura roseirufa TaxID=2094049 RepID=UPI0010415BE4
MQELRLVAVSEDGTYLVLATAGRGTRFTLPVDDRLRAAVRGHFSRLGQFEIEVESPLRPKEIQARIRSGETAEEIAESAGIPVERVRWFEGPVLQEREYMAQQAQRVPVRRPGETAPGPPLGETVEERLGRGGVDLEEVEWDSWKCEDNTWRVRLSFFDNGRPHAAEWVFDPRRRHVSPLDEIAARLTAVEWDDEGLSDTVTPLVPRRPAMKVVSDGRDLTARGIPSEAEHPGERSPEPLRAAAPREYVVERARVLEPRPSFSARDAGESSRLREAADRRPAESAPLRRASAPRETARFQEPEDGDLYDGRYDEDTTETAAAHPAAPSLIGTADEFHDDAASAESDLVDADPAADEPDEDVQEQETLQADELAEALDAEDAEADQARQDTEPGEAAPQSADTEISAETDEDPATEAQDAGPDGDLAEDAPEGAAAVSHDAHEDDAREEDRPAAAVTGEAEPDEDAREDDEAPAAPPAEDLTEEDVPEQEPAERETGEDPAPAAAAPADVEPEAAPAPAPRP